MPPRTQINLRLSDELLAEVDEVRGEVPRERFIRLALERALDESLDTGKAKELAERTDALRSAIDLLSDDLMRHAQILQQILPALDKAGLLENTAPVQQLLDRSIKFYDRLREIGE